MTTKGSLGNNDDDGNENGNKARSLITIFVKQKLWTCIAFFAHFLAIVARLRHKNEKRALFTEQVNITQKVSFSFSKLRYGPSGFNPENFADIWQIKRNWIRLMKFETVQIYFLSKFSLCCHLKIWLPRQGDVTTSPLYSLYFWAIRAGIW